MTATAKSPTLRRAGARLSLGALLLCLSLPAATTGCGASVPPPRARAAAGDDVEWRMDVGLELLADKSYGEAATTFFGIFSSLPESDLRRDIAAFHLARALVALGHVQAGAQHYFDVVSGRRVPEFVNKSLVELKPLYEAHRIDRDRMLEGVLYGNQYSELSPEIADFVEYLQGLTEVRHGFVEWGNARLEALAAAKKPYSFHASYSLAVERMAHREDAAATTALDAVVHANAAPAELRDEARLALARIAYEKKHYDEAWRLFVAMRSPIRLQDAVILEKAWDLVAKDDEQRALGFIVGLGAPAYRHIFAPDRDLIRALALRRLCQYRAAHLAVREFHAAYGPVLAAIRDGRAPADEPAVRRWAIEGDSPLAEADELRTRLVAERGRVDSIGDKALRAHLASIYDSQIAREDATIARAIDDGAIRVVDELLRVEEQINLIDYEVGVGIFKSGGATASSTVTLRPEDIPAVSRQVYFHFDGEYWSDEINDYSVLVDNRCVK